MGQSMTLDEARDLVSSPLWPKVRDRFLATGEFVAYPRGDLRRVEFLDDATRRSLGLWMQGVIHFDEWRHVVNGEDVRRLKSEYPGVYPEIFRYGAYFKSAKNPLEVLLRLKFPEAYRLCCC